MNAIWKNLAIRYHSDILYRAEIEAKAAAGDKVAHAILATAKAQQSK